MVCALESGTRRLDGAARHPYRESAFAFWLDDAMMAADFFIFFFHDDSHFAAL